MDKITVDICPNCKEPLNDNCACFRNKCADCGKPVGNITFTVCDECWDKGHEKITVKTVEAKQISPHVIMVKLHVGLPNGMKVISFELAHKIRDRLNEVLNK